MSESALASTKEKKLSGGQWFETVVQQLKRMDPMKKMLDFDDDEDFEGSYLSFVFCSSLEVCSDLNIDDEDDMLEHYLAEKDSSAHSSS
ncbi:hypothetical protein Tco_1052489, partial [Tanacetum coccineum]